MATASATAASSARAAAAPRATRRTPTPRRGALAGLLSIARATRTAAAPSDARFTASAESPACAGGGPRPTSPDARPVPPAKGPGSAAAALQAASTVEDLLAGASLLVLPAEESAHWHAQRLHRAKRRGAASRALVRLARWLAPESNLGAGGAREACVSDARFARLVEAAACAYPEDAIDEDDAERARARLDADLELATDAFRALGSLAPMPNRALRLHAATIGARVAGIDDGTSNPRDARAFDVPPHRASVGSWACARLGLDPTSAAARAFSEAGRATPFRVLPNLLDDTTLEASRDDANDASVDARVSATDHLDASVAGGWTSAAELLAAAADGDGASETRDVFDAPLTPAQRASLTALSVASLAREVPFKVEQLVTRDGTRVDERRETCWMADEGIGGLAYSGKVMRPTPFTPTVDALRRLVCEKTGQRFDCALLNLYPERSVACKYHKDPDLGRLWARDSVIVSVGETRRFAFRADAKGGARGGAAGKRKPSHGPEHWFRVRGGDAVWMFGDCNDTWEHCVMPGESDADAGGAAATEAPRASVVFKRSLAVGERGGARGHAVRSSPRNRRGGGSNPGRGKPEKRGKRGTPVKRGGGGRGRRGGGRGLGGG